MIDQPDTLAATSEQTTIDAAEPAVLSDGPDLIEVRATISISGRHGRLACGAHALVDRNDPWTATLLDRQILVPLDVDG